MADKIFMEKLKVSFKNFRMRFFFGRETDKTVTLMRRSQYLMFSASYLKMRLVFSTDSDYIQF
jgi:hypothetical protein